MRDITALEVPAPSTPMDPQFSFPLTHSCVLRTNNGGEIYGQIEGFTSASGELAVAFSSPGESGEWYTTFILVSRITDMLPLPCFRCIADFPAGGHEILADDHGNVGYAISREWQEIKHPNGIRDGHWVYRLGFGLPGGYVHWFVPEGSLTKVNLDGKRPWMVTRFDFEGEDNPYPGIYPEGD